MKNYLSKKLQTSELMFIAMVVESDINFIGPKALNLCEVSNGITIDVTVGIKIIRFKGYDPLPDSHLPWTQYLWYKTNWDQNIVNSTGSKIAIWV